MRVVNPTPDIEMVQADFRDIFDLLTPADMVLSDPPYGVGYYSKRDGSYDRKRIISQDTELRLWPVHPMSELLKNGGVMVLFTREDVADEWRYEMTACGLTMKTSVIWDKRQWSAGDHAGDLRRQTEMALVGHKGRALLREWRDDWGLAGPEGKVVKRDTSLWSHAAPRSRARERHPTAKPVDLMMRAILNWSDPGDTILDPFMGGGPVAIAAHRTGRRYVGVEIDTRYFDLAVDNFNEALNHERT